MDKKILIVKENESYVRVVTDDMKVERSLENYFSVYAKNFRFSPKYQNGYWDGKIKFYSRKTLLSGLLPRLIKFLNGSKWKNDYEVVESLKVKDNYNQDEVDTFIDDLNLPFSPYDYQLAAFYDYVKKKRGVIKISTSGGKSLVIYFMVLWNLLHKKNTLIIVPTKGLVTQIYNDFMDYWYRHGYIIEERMSRAKYRYDKAKKEHWKNIYKEYYELKKIELKIIQDSRKQFQTDEIETYLQTITGKTKEKKFRKPVIISTWQSQYKDKKQLKKIDALIIDEAHHAKSTEVSKIAKNATNATYRIGLTGTLKTEEDADLFTIEGCLGEPVVYADYNKLREQNIITTLKIYNVSLRYNDNFKKDFWEKVGKNYQLEVQHIVECERRNELIRNFVKTRKKGLKGNTLVLFTLIKHGHKLREMFEKEMSDKQIFYIDGDTKDDYREMAKATAEKYDNVVIIASYGTFSTGINIKNLHNIVFASFYKSEYKVLQSIGRGLRKNKNKVVINVFDLIDDLRYIDKYDVNHVNFAYKHFLERLQYYKREKFHFKNIFLDI